MGMPGSDRATAEDDLAGMLAPADLILDALIGYSLRGAPDGPAAGFIGTANAAGAPRLALDLPSGLDGDSGLPQKPCIRAAATLTLAWPKSGLLTDQAAHVVGQLFLADISIPAGIYRAVGVEPDALFARGPLVRALPVAGGWEAGPALGR